jgi:hypothetical protein
LWPFAWRLRTSLQVVFSIVQGRSGGYPPSGKSLVADITLVGLFLGI